STHTSWIRVVEPTDAAKIEKGRSLTHIVHTTVVKKTMNFEPEGRIEGIAKDLRLHHRRETAKRRAVHPSPLGVRHKVAQCSALINFSRLHAVSSPPNPGNAGGRAGAWRTAIGVSQIRDFYSLLDGSQSSILLPSGSVTHANFP